MKKYMILISLLLTVALPYSFASSSRDGDDGEPIPIQVNEPDDEEGNNHFRSPGIIPIEAYLVSSTQNVAINFLYPVGIVTITLSNLSTSDYFVTVVDSGVGSVLLPVSLGTGFYRIEFNCLDCGNEYVGYFNN